MVSVNVLAPTGASIPCLVALSNGRLRLSRVSGADEALLLDVSLDRAGPPTSVSESAVSFAVDHSVLVADFAAGGQGERPRHYDRLRTKPLKSAWRHQPKQRFINALSSPPTAPASHFPIAGNDRIPERRPMQRVGPNQAPQAGLFVSHISAPRIGRHFRRLVKETDSLVGWLVFNPNDRPRLPKPTGYAALLPSRQRQMERRSHMQGGVFGEVQGGFLDVALIPHLLAVEAAHVWVMEYDVDYAGCWDEFFAQFTDNDADLLTTTVAHRSETPQWAHWRSAAAPNWVQERHFHRAFNPLMRLSRTFAVTYAVMMADSRWQGHYEFTLPTAAVASNATLEDLGGGGTFTPRSRRNLNYTNNPSDWQLLPGTFTWRPARTHYFSERPQAFPQPNQLYHPIKPDIDPWEQQPTGRAEQMVVIDESDS